MVGALKCDQCKKFTEEGHSLLYRFVGFYSDEREDFAARMLDCHDLCDDCFGIVERKLKEILE